MHRVGEERVRVAAVGARLVRAQHLGGGDDRDDDPVRRVGAVVVPEGEVQREQPAVVVEARGDDLLLGPLVRAGDEVLAAVLGPLHLVRDARPGEPAGGPRHQHLLRPRVHDLDAETAAHVGRDALDLVRRHLQLGGDRHPHRRRGLGRGVDPDRVLVAVPDRVDALALHRHAGRPLDVELEGEGVRRGGHHRLEVADLLQQVRGHVVGDVGVDRVHGGPRCGQAHHRWQDVVGHDDPLAGVLGEVAVGGDHHDDRLADVVDLLARQRVPGARAGQRRVRDQQRERLRDGRDRHGRVVRVDAVEQVLVGVDRDHAVDVERAARVDVQHPGVRVRAADEGGDQGVVTEVVEVPAFARAAAAGPRGAGSARRPSGWSRAALLALQLGRPQHRRPDVLVPGAAAQVAGDRLGRLVLGRIRVGLEVGRRSSSRTRGCRNRTGRRRSPTEPTGRGASPPARRCPPP